MGIEPTTVGLQVWRLTNWAKQVLPTYIHYVIMGIYNYQYCTRRWLAGQDIPEYSKIS